MDDYHEGLNQFKKADKVSTEPLLNDLYLHVTPHYAADWEVIGTLLGLPSGELRAIKAGNPTDVKWCCNQMWIHWLQVDITASWEKLFVVIESPAVSYSASDKGQLAQDENSAAQASQQHEVRQPQKSNLKRLLKDAVENGKVIEFKHVKIFLTGSSAAGKTSFRRSLFKKKFVKKYTSTVLQETKHAYVASVLQSTDGDDDDDDVEWQELTPEHQIDHFKKLLKSRTKEIEADSSIDNGENVRKVDNFEPTKGLIEQLNVNKDLTPISRIPNPASLITIVDTGGQPEFINMLPAIISYPTINLVVLDMTKKLTDRVEHYKTLKKQEHEHTEKEKKVKVEIHYEIQEEGKIKKEDKVEVVCYKVKKDQVNEGQVKKDEVKVKGCYKVKEEEGDIKVQDDVELYMHYKMYEDKKPLYYLSHTYEDLIKLLMSITNNVLIQKSIQKQDDSEQRASHSKSLDIIKKPSKYYIGFVGTHKDEVDKKTIKQLDNQLHKLVRREKQQKCNVLPLSGGDEDEETYLYPVDNTKSESGEDKQVNEIRKKIKDVTTWMEPFTVPITWMILQIQVKSLCDSKSKPYITLEEFTEIAYKEASFETTEDVESVLEYFDLLGIFLYFKEMKNYVIIDQQWFCNTLCKLVGLSPDDNPNIDIQKKFKNEGLLCKSVLKNIKWDKMTKEIIEPLLGLLVDKKILACYENDYYFPHALPYCEHYHDKCKYLLAEPLLVRFSGGFLPTGFFCTLVIHLLQTKSRKWTKLNCSQAYSNVITFKVDDTLFLRLQDKRFYIEVQARHQKSNAERCMLHELECLREHLGEVCTTLKLDSDKLEYGFLCTGPLEDNHMVVLDSIENPCLKQCDYEGCKMYNEMGRLYKVWFEECQIEDEQTFDAKRQKRRHPVDSNANNKRRKTFDNKQTGTKILDRFGRPTNKQLSNHVISKVCKEWRALGLELLDSKDEHKLGTIEKDSKNEGSEICCWKMFDEWLNYDNVSWDQLVQAIRKIGLDYYASEIEKLFKCKAVHNHLLLDCS